jgi:hypothetical protein
MFMGKYLLSCHNDCYLMDEEFFTTEQKKEDV